MNKPFYFWFAPFLTLAALAASCQDVGPPSTLVVGIDTSCSKEELLVRYASAIFKAQRRLRSGQSLEVFAFAHQLDLLYRGERFVARDRFNSAVATKLAQGTSGFARPGTRTDLMLDEMAKEAEASLVSVVAVIATDGGIEGDPAEVDRRMKSAVVRLLTTKNLRRLLVIGVSRESRLRWTNWLAPLGDRGSVCGDSDFGHPLSTLTLMESEASR